MKKSGLSIPLLISMVSIIVIVIVVVSYQQKEVTSNDNKYKLTLLNKAKKVPVLKSIIEQNLAKQQASAPAADENVLVIERVYTEQELNKMSEEQFAALLKDMEIRLPKLSDIKSLPAGALHRTPPVILEAGRELGLIKEILKIHESYERVAAPFYKNCAKKDDGTTPVRALCLTNLIEIKKKNGEVLNLAEFPGQIVELSRMITDI